MARGKHWTPEQKEKLKEIYETASKEELQKAFPGRPFGSIYCLALRLGLSKRTKRAQDARAARNYKMNLPTEKAGQKWTTNELQILENMIEDRASPTNFCLEFKRPLAEVLAEAKNRGLDVDYLKGKKLPQFKPAIRVKDVKAEVRELPVKVILKLDLVLKINSVRMEEK